MGKKLFVGGLSWDTTDQSLRTAFEVYGEILDAKVILDRETGRSRGFGFVTVAEDETATKALEGMNGAQLDGRAVRVNIAEERSNRGRPRSPSSSPPQVQRRGSYGTGGRSDSRSHSSGHSPRRHDRGPGHSGGHGGWRPPPDGATAGGIPFDPGPSGRTDEQYKRKKQKKKRRQGGEQGEGDGRERSGSSKRQSGRNWRDFGANYDDDE